MNKESKLGTFNLNAFMAVMLPTDKVVQLEFLDDIYALIKLSVEKHGGRCGGGFTLTRIEDE